MVDTIKMRGGGESYIKTGNCTEITLNDLYDEEFLKKLEYNNHMITTKRLSDFMDTTEEYVININTSDDDLIEVSLKGTKVYVQIAVIDGVMSLWHEGKVLANIKDVE